MERSPTTTFSDSQGIPPEGIFRLESGVTEKGGCWSTTLGPAEIGALRRLHYAPAGVVFGSAVYQLEIPYGAYFQNQELEKLSDVLSRARRAAVSRMCEEARYVGAEGVLGVCLETETMDWSTGILEVRARGTALISSDGSHASPAKPWSTSLQVAELGELHEIGMRPVSLIVGNCVFHVAHQEITQTIRRFGENAELQTFSRALGGAREIAVHRMELAGRELQAAGIMNVYTAQLTHSWRAHVLEYFACGNAVAEMPERENDLSLYKHGRSSKHFA